MGAGARHAPRGQAAAHALPDPEDREKRSSEGVLGTPSPGFSVNIAGLIADLPPAASAVNTVKVTSLQTLLIVVLSSLSY